MLQSSTLCSSRFGKSSGAVAKWLLTASMVMALGCGKAANDKPAATPAPAGATADKGMAPPEKATGGTQTGTAAPSGSLDTWFVTGDYQVAVVLQPQKSLNSEFAKSLPHDVIEEQKAKIQRDSGGAPVEALSKIELVAIVAKTPEDLTNLPGTDPGTLHAAVYVRFTEPMTFEKLSELLKAPPLEKGEMGGKTYYKLPMGGLVPLDDKTYVAATTAALETVIAGKPMKNPLATQLAKADASSELVIAFALDGLNDKLAEMAEPFAGMAPPELMSLPKQIQGGCITAGVSGTSLLKVMISGKTAGDAEKIETEANKGLAHLKELWKSVPAQSPPDAKPLIDIGEKMVQSITVTRTAETVTLDVKNPSSWKDVVAALEPAIKKARDAAKTVVRMNNLKQVGLAFHNYAEVHREFPVTHTDPKFYKDGKPVLSWRVHVLPYLDSANLYNQLKMDEPADSATNKPLLGMAPEVYRDESVTDKSQTRIVRLTGPQTLCPNDKKMYFSDVSDGMSNTIMAIELPPGKTISWTSTEDIVFNPEKPLDGIGSIPPEGLLVLLADGSVRKLRADVKPEVFKALVTPAGAEVIDAEAAFQ